MNVATTGQRLSILSRLERRVPIADDSVCVLSKKPLDSNDPEVPFVRDLTNVTWSRERDCTAGMMTRGEKIMNGV